MSDGRRLDVGNVLETPNGELEVVSVSSQETEDGVKHTFGYTLRHKDELDLERAEQKRRDEEIAAAQTAEEITDTVG